MRVILNNILFPLNELILYGLYMTTIVKENKRVISVLHNTIPEGSVYVIDN